MVPKSNPRSKPSPRKPAVGTRKRPAPDRGFPGEKTKIYK